MREIQLDLPLEQNSKAPRTTFLMYGPSGSGKCVTGDTRILSPDGRYERIDDVVRWGKFSTLSVGESGAGGLRSSEPSHYLDMGISKIYEMILADGRSLRGTPEHPVLTSDGFVPLGKLREGDDIVVADQLPYFGNVGPKAWEPELLAYLIADGNLTQAAPSFTKKNLEHRDRFIALVEAAGDSWKMPKTREGFTEQIRLNGGAVKEWLSDLGLWGRASRKKFVPSEVFTWNKKALSTFLSTLFTCDGHITSSPVDGRRFPVVDLGYSSSSRRLLDDVAHLLRRFSIRSRSRYVKGLLNGVEHGGFVLHVGGLEHLSRFVDEIGIDRPKAKEISEQAKERLRITPSSDRGAYRDGLRLEAVKSIEAAGEAQVFDLTIPGVHNFLANDLIVHNTTLAASFPRPLFLSDVTESGYESLRGLDENVLFEPNVRPRVWGIEKMNDMAQAFDNAAPLVAAGAVQTVVIDSLTYYSDLYLNSLFAMQGPNADNRKAYGALGIHLRDQRIKWHGLQCNIVWLALVQEPNEDLAMGGPMIPGAQAGKFGAGCDYTLFLRHDRFKQGQQMVDQFEVHSRNCGRYAARIRRAIGVAEIPTPLVNTSYSDIITFMGFDPEATRKALPAYIAPKPLTFVAPAAPPSQAQSQAPVAARPAAPAAAPHVPNAARPAASNGARPQPSAPVVTRRPAPGRPNS